MATETTFFSYSRSDSEFVLRLAKDLRQAGENLWLDQLDIPAGSRWDASIEAALNTATRMIIVLSPDSVSSDNVMDEVSYALESGKTVIPVLLKECDPPFRLRRLQRIDFTGDYQTGLRKLLVAVGPNAEKELNESNDLQEVSQTAIPTESKEQPHYKQQESKSEENTESAFLSTENPEGKSKKYFWFIGGAVLIALVVWGVMKMGKDGNGKDPHANNDDAVEWEKTLLQNDSMAFAHYLEHFPDGNFADQAKQKIDSISNAKQLADSKDPKKEIEEPAKDNGSRPGKEEPIEQPYTRPRHPLKKTPFYGIMISSAKTESEAKSKARDMKRTGVESDYLWIPDYASLSGAEAYAIYIGPIATQKECEEMTQKVRRKFSGAYGLLVSQERVRVQIYGVGKVTVTKIPLKRK